MYHFETGFNLNSLVKVLNAKRLEVSFRIAAGRKQLRDSTHN